MKITFRNVPKKIHFLTFVFVVIFLNFVSKAIFLFAGTVPETIGEERIMHLLEESVNPNEETSTRAYYELENLGPVIIPKFIEILKDENKKKYHDKIHELLSYGILRNIYHDREYYNVILSGEIKNELSDIYSEDPFALGFIDSEKSISILKKMLKEPGKYRTIVVIDALGRIAEDKESVEMIKKAWKEDIPRSWVSDFAENAVKKITLRRILKQLKTEEKVIFLKNLLEYETEPRMKSELIWEIVRTKQKDLLLVLIEHYGSPLVGEAGEYAHQAIEYYLASLLPNEALKEIEKGDTFFKERIISILDNGEYFQSRIILEMIAEKDPDEKIRKKCIERLQVIKKWVPLSHLKKRR